MTTFKIDFDAVCSAANSAGEPWHRKTVAAVLRGVGEQLRADPRGKDLPEDPSEAFGVLLAGSAALDAADDMMPSHSDVLKAYGDAIEGTAYGTGATAIRDLFRPVVGAAIAERNIWKDSALDCHIVLTEIRHALGITPDEWNNAPWTALVPRVKALVARASATPPAPTEPTRSPYVVGDATSLELALAFVDEVLVGAGHPRIERATLPELGRAGWATAWLSQVTLARMAAARTPHPEAQRRIHVAAIELERILFGLFDRAYPAPVASKSTPPTKKGGGRNAAT
jgi:hypothetical protein